MTLGALARTRFLLAAEYRPVPLAMSKWWAKKRPAEAEITMHLSPNEQHPVLPWLKTFPKKAVDRIPTYLWPFGTFAFIAGVVQWAEARDHAEDYGHRF